MKNKLKRSSNNTHSDLNQFYQGTDSASVYELNLQCSIEF